MVACKYGISLLVFNSTSVVVKFHIYARPCIILYLSNSAIWYKSPDTVKKKKRAEWFNSLNSAQKQKRAEWYKSLNPEEQEKLLSGRAEWYKTLDPADKDKIFSQVQTNKEAHRNSVQRDLVY